MTTENLIPPIDPEWADIWKQPKLSEITIYHGKALMGQRAFDKLKEYSCSNPTGVYVGKMWKACPSNHNPNAPAGVWYLRWFGKSSEPNKCTWNSIEIELCLPEPAIVVEESSNEIATV